MTPLYLLLVALWLAIAVGVVTAAGVLMLLWYCFGFADPERFEPADVAQSDRAPSKRLAAGSSPAVRAVT
jgi:hypothetical protein